MTSCERCWNEAKRRGVDYSAQVFAAEVNGDECTKDTPEGKRLRAGEYWDEARGVDRRLAPTEGVV